MVCPFIDKELKACSEVLNIQHVDQALQMCADDFGACETFLRNDQRVHFSIRDMFRRGKPNHRRKA